MREVSAETDLADFFGFMAKEHYWRQVPIEIPTLEWVTGFLRGQEEAARQQPRSLYYLAARDRRTGAFVGDASLRMWGGGSADIGWSVDAALCGQGLATEIGVALLHFGFEELGLHRICAMCRVGNIASRRVMEKLGMQEEGTLREHLYARGEWWSSWMCSVLATDPWPLVTEQG